MREGDLGWRGDDKEKAAGNDGEQGGRRQRKHSG